MTTAQQPGVQVQNDEEAYGILMEHVYAPVFFKKLASDFGIQPANVGEAGRMIRMAQLLRQDYETKQAAAGESFLDFAEKQLQTKLAGAVTQQSVDQQVEAAASRLATDPTLAHAVLSLQKQAGVFG